MSSQCARKSMQLLLAVATASHNHLHPAFTLDSRTFSDGNSPGTVQYHVGALIKGAIPLPQASHLSVVAAGTSGVVTFVASSYGARTPDCIIWSLSRIIAPQLPQLTLATPSSVTLKRLWWPLSSMYCTVA
ncbi:hypothetical protein LXA43DRAFT_1069906 [Ganoderma leucocontextum]|nr:hypothetical protein LXA43DRAFT_1069906 [Ganoderma leucocontextum]